MHLKLHAHTVLREILAGTAIFLMIAHKGKVIRERVIRWILKRLHVRSKGMNMNQVSLLAQYCHCRPLIFLIIVNEI